MGQPLLSGKATSNFTGVDVFYILVTFGSSAVSTVRTRDCTFTRAGAGSYTITLPRIYRRLLHVSAMQVDASGGVLLPVVDTDAVASAGTITFEYRTEAGTATDPDDTTQALIKVEVSNDPFNDNTV
jgi:hypothetical protein